MNHARLISGFAAIALIAWCAATASAQDGEPTLQASEQVARSLVGGWDRQTRVSGIAYPVLVANADLCGKRVVNDLGFDWVTLKDFEDRTGRAVAGRLGVSNLPYVAGVVPGSAADDAGMRRGDTLLSINGADVREDAGWRSHAYVETRRWGRERQTRRRVRQALMKAAEDGSPVVIRLRRGDVEHGVELRPTRKCDVDVVVVADRRRLAMVSHSHRVFVSSGLIEFVQSEAELQSLVAHELGHHIAGHYRERTLKKIIAGAVGGLLTAPVFLAAAAPGAIESSSGGPAEAIAGGVAQATETAANAAVVTGGFFGELGGRIGRHRHELEADYIGSYALARAGVDAGQAVDVWRRMPGDSMLLREHVRKDSRAENLAKSIAEVDGRRNADEPLIPNSDRRPSN